jgi:hypothetical protein
MKFFEDKIYGFGRDKMGIYMISGHLKAPDADDPSKKRDIEFSTYYERDYVIEFKGTITGDEIVSLL